MKFESWISLQQRTFDALLVRPGRYLARFDSKADGGRGEYRAALQVTRAAHGPIVEVSRDDTTRARVILGACEYDFEPVWQLGTGLAAARRSPRHIERDEAITAAGYARAALLAAAREEHERLSGLAMDAADRLARVSWEALLIALTTGKLEGAHRAVIMELLAERDDGAEYSEARRAAECIGCQRRFQRGDSGPVVEFGTTVCCVGCLSGGSGGRWVVYAPRRPWAAAPPIALADLAAAVEEGDSLIISRERELR